MIVDDFLCWVEAAKVPERTKAASALTRAYLLGRFEKHEQRSAEMAIACLLDDPALSVRLAVADAMAHAKNAPRGIILSLCNDKLEIACTIIAQSPVLTTNDLVDLAVKGNSAQRVMIANRTTVTRPVAAAICEIGNAPELVQLLSNSGADIPVSALVRLAERMADNAEIRQLLLERSDLPVKARHMLVCKVSDVLASSGLMQLTYQGRRKADPVATAQDNALAVVAGNSSQAGLPDFVEHLRQCECLTPIFIMRTLCAGHAEFFAEILSNLSGVIPRRVRAILSEGRAYAVRALMESAGFDREISPLYVECVLLWRKQAAGPSNEANVAMALAAWGRGRNDLSTAAQELLELVEQIGIDLMRETARQYAARITLQAA